MKIKLAAIIGMVLILATSAVPAQAAGLPLSRCEGSIRENGVPPFRYSGGEG